VSNHDADAADRDDAAEPFLQRWSRLKSATRDAGRSSDPPDETTPPSQVDKGPPEPPASAGGAAPAAIALPDLESLGPDSDYSAFLGRDIDVSLRRAALRKLFRSPKFNVLDGLDDYCGDFTQFAPLAGIVTADMRHHVERAAKELLSSDKVTGPRLPADEEPSPLLSDDAAGGAGSAPAADTAASSGIASGDAGRPATEESEQDADRRPA